MSKIERNGGEFIVDANLLASAFDLTPDDVRTRIRNGHITSLCEAGQDEDEGRWRITFYAGARALRLIVDRDGTHLSQSTFPVRARTRDIATGR